MPRRETVAQAYQRGYENGLAAGATAKSKELAKQFEIRNQQLQALEAVTKLVSHAGQALGALSNVFDNGPRT